MSDQPLPAPNSKKHDFNLETDELLGNAMFGVTRISTSTAGSEVVKPVTASLEEITSLSAGSGSLAVLDANIPMLSRCATNEAFCNRCFRLV